MKAAYLGGTRGYSSANYRPGIGWMGPGRRGHHGYPRPVVAVRAGVRISPLSTASPRHSGLVRKAVILTLIVAVALVMAIVFDGLALF
jgi:hypothetical protein